MTRTYIIKHFKINTKSRKSLYLQLRDKIEHFIQHHAAGTLLPPERKLAETLKISRNTIRKALDQFVDIGLLERDRSGTAIAGQLPDSNQEELAHPMNFDSIQLPQANRTIHFALYENLPHQKQFWETMVSQFNQRQLQYHIKIDWVPANVNKSIPYDVYLQETNPDIFLLSSPYIPMAVKSNLLSPVPAELQERLSGNDYWQHIYSLPGIVPNYMVPVHVANWGIFWNQELAEKHGLATIREEIKHKRLLAVFHTAAEKMTQLDTVSGHIWNYIASRGFPYQEQTLDDIRNYFEETFNGLSSHLSVKHSIFLLSQKYSAEALDLFKNQKMFSYIGNSTFMFLKNKDFDFKLNGMWLSVPQTHYLPTSFSSLAVNSKSLKKDAAWQFIDMITASDAQQALTKAKVNCAVLKSANTHYNTALDKSTMDELNSSIQSLSAQLKIQHILPELVISGNRDIYPKLLNNDLSPTEAAGEIVERLQTFE